MVGDLPDDVRDTDRTAQLIRRFMTDDDAADIAQRLIDNLPSLLESPSKLRCGGETGWNFRSSARHRPADAENADATDIAQSDP